MSQAFQEYSLRKSFIIRKTSRQVLNPYNLRKWSIINYTTCLHPHWKSYKKTIRQALRPHHLRKRSIKNCTTSLQPHNVRRWDKKTIRQASHPHDLRKNILEKSYVKYYICITSESSIIRKLHVKHSNHITRGGSTVREVLGEISAKPTEGQRNFKKFKQSRNIINMEHVYREGYPGNLKIKEGVQICTNQICPI